MGFSLRFSCFCRRLLGGFSRNVAPILGRPASRERIRPVEPAPPLHIVAHDGEGYGGLGAALADGSDHQPHCALEDGEGMFDARPDRGLAGVGPRGSAGQGLSLGLFAMDAADFADIREMVFVRLGAVGRIGPDVGGGVVRINQSLAQPGAIMGGGICDDPAAEYRLQLYMCNFPSAC
jgi:hypothetical protein